MALVSIGLWVAGVALLVLAAMSARTPLARIRELDATQANLRRYEDWRGGRRTAAERPEVTGADIMRQQLRAQLTRWGAVAVAGVVLIVAGFAVR